MRALVTTTLALVALTGCSIFNKPDRGRLDGGPSDVGLDGGVDGGADADAWVGDAYVPDAWMCPGGNTEGMCSDGRDDDCDGLVDCADPDCVIAGAAACCTAGATAVTEHFDVTGGAWTTRGNWVDPLPATAIGTMGLSDLGTGATVGMVNNACLHVDLGMDVRFSMRALGCTGTGCNSGRLEVVIGPSTTFSGMLTDDLAIRGVATAPGVLRIEVVQGGTVRGASDMLSLGSGATDVVVTLSPGIANGRAAVVATVVASQGSMTQTIVSQIYVTNRDVFGTSSCHGLRLGVQGTGSAVALDDLRIAQLNCANPARFDHLSADSDTIDAVTVAVSNAGHTMGWGRGGIGDPAILEGTLAGSTTHRFMLMFDGSPVDRASDVIGHLPLTIGAADTTYTGSGTSLVVTQDCAQWIPRGGALFCTPPPTASGSLLDPQTPSLVMRDPTFYPESQDPTMPISSFRVAWVGETAPGSALRLFTTTLNSTVGSRIGGVPAVTTTDETCSMRNPLLLPNIGTPRTSDWYLFYLCDSFPPVVHAAILEGGSATVVPGFALGETQLGPLARQGVTDIAGVVFDYVHGSEHTPTYRLWLTTRPTTTESTVLFVEGTPPRDAPIDTFPEFVPFPGNPVLREDSTLFSGSCGVGCQLRGITATRLSTDPARVRLLVERWVDSGSGLTYGLVPLEQVWPAD